MDVDQVRAGPNGGHVEFTDGAHGREHLLAMLVPHAVVNRDVTLYMGGRGWLSPRDIDCTAWAAAGDERCVTMHRSFSFATAYPDVVDFGLLTCVYPGDEGRPLAWPVPDSLEVGSAAPQELFELLEYFPRLTSLRLQDSAQLDLADISDYLAATLTTLVLQWHGDPYYYTWAHRNGKRARRMHLGSLPALVGLHNLRTLRFSTSEVQGLPALPQLTHLDLQLVSGRTEDLAFLGGMTGLTTLQLRDLGVLHPSVDAACAALPHLSTLVLRRSVPEALDWLARLSNLSSFVLVMDSGHTVPSGVKEFMASAGPDLDVTLHGTLPLALATAARRVRHPEHARRRASCPEVFDVVDDAYRCVPAVPELLTAHCGDKELGCLAPWLGPAPGPTPCPLLALGSLFLRCAGEAATVRCVLALRSLRHLALTDCRSEHDALLVATGLPLLESLSLAHSYDRDRSTDVEWLHDSSLEGYLRSVEAGPDEPPQVRTAARSLLADTALLRPAPRNAKEKAAGQEILCGGLSVPAPVCAGATVRTSKGQGRSGATARAVDFHVAGGPTLFPRLLELSTSTGVSTLLSATVAARAPRLTKLYCSSPYVDGQWVQAVTELRPGLRSLSLSQAQRVPGPVLAQCLKKLPLLGALQVHGTSLKSAELRRRHPSLRDVRC